VELSMLKDHLALAERHAAEGEARIVKQHDIIAELERDGHDTKQARDLLRVFEETQVSFVADRDRLRSEVSKAE
jgi:hypothetical protein